GTRYSWRTPEGVPTTEIPRVDDLAELPAEWLQGLTVRARGEADWNAVSVADLTDDEVLKELKRFMPGPACSDVAAWEAERLDAATRQKGTAHDALLRPCLMRVRCGLATCTGATHALARI